MSLQVFFENLLQIGVNSSKPTRDNRRTVFFNAILITLPVVYLIVMVLDYKSYIVPISSWHFDNFSFIFFIGICILCLLLNKINLVKISKLIFIISWPLLLHIIPIIIQNTPVDYYFVFPIGLIFHSIMIQAIFSRSAHSISYWILMATNFFLMLNFFDFMLYYDDDKSIVTNPLLNEYYNLGVIIYWLLFNLLIGYLFQIIDQNMDAEELAKSTILDQNIALTETLDKLKKTQSQLLQSEKMSSIGTFTAGIAHEINNPLNYIMGGLKELSSVAVSNDKEEIKSIISNAGNMIENGLSRSTKIIRALLELSYETNKDSKKQFHDVSNILENTVLLTKHNLPEDTELILTLNSHERVLVYSEQIHQALLNIVSNAIDELKNERNPQLQITTETIDNNGERFVDIKIRNTGSRIPEINMRKIFDPFFTTKDPGEGTGLGLWITYKIIDEHEGKISVKNTSNGVEFTISLPVKYDD